MYGSCTATPALQIVRRRQVGPTPSFDSRRSHSTSCLRRHGTPAPWLRTEFGEIGDQDPFVLAASAWIPLPAGADPAALDYELYTVQDALAVAYSDRPGFGAGPAVRFAAPVVLMTRFGELDPQRQPVPGSVGPWREGSATPSSSSNAVQILVLFDGATAGAGSDVRVEALRLSF